MEASSSKLSDSDRTAPDASKLLANLPSRGLFSSTVLYSNPGTMQVYLCDHDTSPPDDQEIKTNQQNILIRSLALKKQKSDSSSKGVKESASEGPRKRTAERALDGKASAKKANSQQEGSNSGAAERDLHALTVERLRALLKEKGLSPKGKKDELIARLKNVNL